MKTKLMFLLTEHKFYLKAFIYNKNIFVIIITYYKPLRQKNTKMNQILLQKSVDISI